ncbi:hypothetical protein [Qipengyuania zhejiangensis]|uniref:hypothetical protein n=1 Tax=Qipengyuania zhejiangensis TaxID=3077782 RepID=UPI002D76AF37|nr:hypothetical protein [Qipengyuania sp. Z2]
MHYAKSRFSHLARLGLAMLAFLATPVLAANGDPVEIGARIEAFGVQSDLTMEDGDDFDSSGFGIRGDVSATVKASTRTEITIDVDAGVFDYEGDSRGTLETVGAALAVTHKLSDSVELRVRARRVENIAVLEAFSADQTSAAARLEWTQGDNRIRVEGEYREREYDTVDQGHSKGYRFSAQYNRRIGPYHWFRIDARAEKMSSDDDTRRSFDRRVVEMKYSLPVAKRLRLRPSVEYREWAYDDRVAVGDPQGDLREDSYVAPAIELAWGRDGRGPYAQASAEYRFRESNDTRYTQDGARVGIKLGYRF